jgi:hypothetical protein
VVFVAEGAAHPTQTPKAREGEWIGHLVFFNPESPYLGKDAPMPTARPRKTDQGKTSKTEAEAPAQVVNPEPAEEQQPPNMVVNVAAADVQVPGETLLSEMSQEGRELYHRTNSRITKRTEDNIRFAYSLGRDVKDLYDGNLERFTPVDLENFKKLLGKQNETLVHHCYTFAKNVSQEEVERMCEAVTSAGRPLSMTHALVLGHVEDKA